MSNRLKDAKVIGEMIRRLRKAQGMSQADLARAIGSPGMQSNFSRWEKGLVPSLGTLSRIAEALGVDIEAFMEEMPEVQSASDYEMGFEDAKRQIAAFIASLTPDPSLNQEPLNRDLRRLHVAAEARKILQARESDKRGGEGDEADRKVEP